MNTAEFNTLVWAWIALAVVLFPIQLFVTAPYGRHTSARWGLLMDNRWGWTIMELVSPLVFGSFFLLGSAPKSTPMWIFFGLWMMHYINRSLIFPWRTRTSGKKIPITIVLSAAFFNVVNGSLNGYWLGTLTEPYPEWWLADPRFFLGLTVFLLGFGINFYSDELLLRLRKPGETGYKIPQGGLFRWISCPNHFGEIVEWSGFAIMCWNLPALSFAIWTAANLIPRAVSHHKWYRRKFDDYPARRKAVIPFLY